MVCVVSAATGSLRLDKPQFMLPGLALGNLASVICQPRTFAIMCRIYTVVMQIIFSIINETSLQIV